MLTNPLYPFVTKAHHALQSQSFRGHMSRNALKGSNACLWLVLTAGTAMAPLTHALAQQAELRGGLSDTQVNRQLFSNISGTGIPSTEYEPFTQSPGSSEPNYAIDHGPFSDISIPERPAPRGRNNEEENIGEAGIDDLATSTTPARTDERRADPSRASAAQAAVPAQVPVRRNDPNPYAPIGLRLGTFNAIPTLEQGLTYTTNADNAADAEEALLSETTLRLDATSDWSRHQATLSAFGTMRQSLSGAEIEEIRAGGDAALQLDLSDLWQARATLGYQVEEESAEYVPETATADDPLRHQISASLGITRDVGRIALSATGELLRDQYSDADLSDGSRLSQEDRNATLALMRLRTGYHLSPTLQPFIELEAGRRFFDNELDQEGYSRSADRYGARAGISLDIAEKLQGEVSAGWLTERLDDDRLGDISGLTLASSLEWSPMRGTTIGLDANTTVNSAGAAGDSGSLLYDGALRLSRQLRANLSGDLAFGVAYEDYANGAHDLTLSAQAASTWWLNRYAGLTGRIRHEKRTSSDETREYDATSVFMGLKLQR